MAENITINADILNGNNWEMLCALTGKAGNIDSPEDVEKILGSIYVNGKNLADTFDHMITKDDIGAFADKVREALSPDKSDYITIMNRNSLVPNPRAVLMDTEGMEEEQRAAYAQKNSTAEERAANHMQRMHDAAIAAENRITELQNYYQQTFVKDFNASMNMIMPGLMAGNDNGFSRSPEAFAAFYMLSKGHTFDEVFSYNPNDAEFNALTDMRKRERDEFYDIFSLAKDSDGNFIKDINAPENVRKFKETTYPALVKMMKGLMNFQYDYIDMSQPESAERAAMYGYLGHMFQELQQQIPYGYGKSTVYASLGLGNSIGQNYESIVSIMAGRNYSPTANNGSVSAENGVYYHELSKHIGGYRGYSEIPIGVMSVSETDAVLTPAISPSSWQASIPAAEYEEFIADPQKNIAERIENTFSKERMGNFYIPIKYDAEMAKIFVDEARSNTKTSDELFKEKVIYNTESAMLKTDIRKRETIAYDNNSVDSALKFLSDATGIAIDNNSAERDIYINAAIDRFVINGVSAREFFGANDASAVENAKKVAYGLSTVFQGIYSGGQYIGNDDMNQKYNEYTDNGKKQLYVFCRNEIGNLTPYRITPQYEKYKADNTNTTFEEISDRFLSEEEVKDYLQYNKSINDMDGFYRTMSYDFGTNHEGRKTAADYTNLAPVPNDNYAEQRRTMAGMPNSELFDYVTQYNHYRDIFYEGKYTKQKNSGRLVLSARYIKEMNEEKVRLAAQGRTDASEWEMEQNIIKSRLIQWHPEYVLGKEEYDRRMDSILKAQHKPTEKEMHEHMEKRINEIMEANTIRYNSGVTKKTAALFDSDISAQSSSYNNAAAAYAKYLNNEPLGDYDQRAFKNSGLKEFPKISFGDIRNGKTFMDFIKRNQDTISISNICINGKSLKEHLGIAAIDELQAERAVEMLRKMTDMQKLSHAVDNAEAGRNPFGTNEIPFISINNGAGKMIPLTFEKEKVPKPLPKVERFSAVRKFFSWKSTIAENERAVREYEASVKESEDASKRNSTVDKVNELSAVYTKMYNKQPLSAAERSIAQSYKLTSSGIDRNPVAAVQSRSVNELRGNRAAAQNLQPTPAVEQHQPTMNGPNMTN